MKELERIKKKLEEEFEENVEIDEESDFPIHEKYVKPKKTKWQK